MKRVLGFVILAIIAVLIVGSTMWAMGWWQALLVWAGAVVIALLIALGIVLVSGE